MASIWTLLLMNLVGFLPRYSADDQQTSHEALLVALALPTELLRLGRITHTEQGRALCVLERTLPTELLRQLSWLGQITHTEQARALCVLKRTLPTEAAQMGGPNHSHEAILCLTHLSYHHYKLYKISWRAD